MDGKKIVVQCRLFLIHEITDGIRKICYSCILISEWFTSNPQKGTWLNHPQYNLHENILTEKKGPDYLLGYDEDIEVILKLDF